MAFTEPDFIEVDGISIVKPTTRFEVGVYVKLGPTHGIVFPGMVLGPRGLKMRNALKGLVERVRSLQKDVNAAATDPSEMGMSEMDLMDYVNDEFETFFTECLKVNYSAEVTDWIMQNIPLTLVTVTQLIEIAQGGENAASSFRSKQ